MLLGASQMKWKVGKIAHSYGGRFVSKLHHTIAKLERILFMLFWGMHFSFGYTLFIWVCNFFGVCNLLGVCPFNLGVHILFGYALYIWVCTFYLDMHFLFGYALFIWVCPSNAHALICTHATASRDSLMNM